MKMSCRTWAAVAGLQDLRATGGYACAMAVDPGDVRPAIPEPQTCAPMSMGLAALAPKRRAR